MEMGLVTERYDGCDYYDCYDCFGLIVMMMMMHLENNMLESLFLEEKFWEAERS